MARSVFIGFLLLFFGSISVFAQKDTLSGSVVEKTTGEAVPLANACLIIDWCFEQDFGKELSKWKNLIEERVYLVVLRDFVWVSTNLSHHRKTVLQF